MYFLTLATILAATTATWLTDIGVAPQVFKYVPEILSAVIAVYVVFAGSRQRFRFVGAQYWIAFGVISIVMICGVLANAVGPGPVFGGVRYYLRAIPLFFLPAVFDYQDWQLRGQLKLLLGIALLQLPTSIYQRLVIMHHHRWSGDPVIGTLKISSVTSVYLIAAICVMAGLALRNRMSKPTFVILFILLIIPTTINETKATLFLLPIGLIATLLVASAPGNRLRVGLAAITLIIMFIVIYIPIYNYFGQVDNPYPTTIQNFFGNKQRVERYVDQGADVGTRKEAGRLDSLWVPLQQFSSDPVHLMFGVGIGNASHSTLGHGFVGQYYALLGRYVDVSSASTFICELGLMGLGMVFWLYWLIFRDALAVAVGARGLMESIALGWVGITAVITIATFYKSIHAFESLSYLFWYFSGLVAATRMRMRMAPSSAGVDAAGR
jgi:hypothetical protein